MDYMERMERIYQREADKLMELQEEFSREKKQARKDYQRGSASITNGFPESGGGGASATESACTEATGTDAAPEAGDGDDDGGDGDGDPDGRRPQHSPLRASRATRQSIGVNLPPENADCELWRLPTVLKRIPVSRTGWLAGVKSGLYPKPLKIGLRAVAWRASDIRALVASL